MPDTKDKRHEWLNESSHDLEDHIEMLRELDNLRVKSAQMRNEGCAVFCGGVDDANAVPVISRAGLVSNPLNLRNEASKSIPDHVEYVV